LHSMRLSKATGASGGLCSSHFASSHVICVCDLLCIKLHVVLQSFPGACHALLCFMNTIAALQVLLTSLEIGSHHFDCFRLTTSKSATDADIDASKLGFLHAKTNMLCHT